MLRFKKMLRPLIVLWQAAPAALPDHRSDIVQWASSKDRRPVWPAASIAAARYDGAIAEDVENLLEEARSAALGQAAFERLEQLLLAHPELPQAAWLMAERHAVEARRAGDAPSAEGDPLRRARALEGPRATAFGAALPSHALQAEPSEGLRWSGVRPRDHVFVDGVATVPGASLTAGLHHLQLFRAGRRISAAWVELGSPPELSIVDPTPACSELDLLGTLAGELRAEPLPGVACRQWAVARPSATGGTELASCRGSHCEVWETTHRAVANNGGAGRDSASPSLADTLETASEALPSWITWGAIGLGSAVATGLILWQTGVFDSPAQSTEFVFTGPTAAAISF